MFRNISTVLLCIFALIAGISLSSCNNTTSVPFPEKELGYTQPVTVPLQFTPEKKLIFDTAKHDGVKPVSIKLDLDKLPSGPFDSTGFKLFPAPPEETYFDFNALSDTAFDPNKLVSTPLRFRTQILNPSPATKVVSPAAQKGNPLAIFDLGPKLGMPAIFVTSMMKDKDGLLWIGSQEGLFRYDGEYVQNILPFSGGYTAVGLAQDNKGRIWFMDQQRFGMIDMHNGTVSVSNARGVGRNTLSKIIKDSEGRIWISKTSANDVIVIDPIAQTFKALGRSSGLPDTEGANDITEDSTGNIWITTPLQGTAIVNWKAGKIKYLKKSNGLFSDSSRAITTDNTGKVWIAVVGSVEAVDIKNGSIKHYTVAKQGLKAAFVGDISTDSKGRIWIGKSQGLDVLDPQNGRVRFIDNSRGLISNWVTSCNEDNNHRMWVATIGGLHMIDQNAETVHPLGTTQIISLMEDTTGSLWVATAKGIQLINPRQKSIHYLDKAHGLGNDFVQSFSKFKQQMWVTSNGGLDIIDPINKTLEHMGKKEGLVSDTVYVVFKDRGGNTWLTGPSNGIDLIDSAKKIILHTDVHGGMADDNIQDVKEDDDRLVWVAGQTGGINVVNLAKRTIQYLNNQPGLRDTCTKTMLTDTYGRIWIGTDKGIYVVDKKRGGITPVTTSNGLSHNRITSLLPYNGSVVAGTNDKVNIITAPVPGSTDSFNSKWHISILNRSEALVREVTNAWATDAITSKGQFLWGDNGVTVINEIRPSSDSITTQITGISLMTKPQYFVNTQSLAGRDTLWANDTFFVKGQNVSDAGVANKKIRWDSVSGAYNMPSNLQVPYNQNYLQFHFVQSHVSRLDVPMYTYILEGIDKNWSPVSASTSTENYLNLPAGKYTFKVSSKGANGKWDEPDSFSFTIIPPWWQTWWAYTLLAILCAVILRAYIVYRSRKLQRENKLLEEKVTLRTTQLQKSLDDLKTTQSQLIQSEKMASLGELTAGIAHEIQNPLNFINNFSEVNKELLTEMKEEIDNGNTTAVKAIANDIINNEEKINHHGKRADAIVKSMLQHSRSNSNTTRESVNINKLADEYLRLAYHGLRAKDKSFNATLKTDYDESLSPGEAGTGGIHIVPQDIGRVILNLITNAFYAVTEKKKNAADKVSGDKYEPTVSVSTKKLGNKVEIKVTDNGNGIPQRVLDKIFQPFFTTKPAGQGTGLGLSLSYDIVKAHGGELNVQTKESEGTTFTIQLPIG